MRGNLTWFSVNNSASTADLDVLEPMGVQVIKASRKPMIVYRDPETGRLLAATGWIFVWRDGRVHVQPRCDTPPALIDGLVSVAAECVERDLHLRDEWRYYRATRTQMGHWCAGILRGISEGNSLFEAEATALSLAAVPGISSAGTSVAERYSRTV